jgi:hypothetical protein
LKNPALSGNVIIQRENQNLESLSKEEVTIQILNDLYTKAVRVKKSQYEKLDFIFKNFSIINFSVSRSNPQITVFSLKNQPFESLDSTIISNSNFKDL